jgi:hypothetical protein
MKNSEIKTTTFAININKEIEGFLKMITGIDNIQEAAEVFGVACVSYYLDPEEILNKVRALPTYCEFITQEEKRLAKERRKAKRRAKNK